MQKERTWAGRERWFIVSLAVLAGAFGTASSKAGLRLPESACGPGAVPSLQQRSDQIAALKESMLRALVQTLPNGSFLTSTKRLFNGNYDWHSSVHNHWALLSIARLTHDQALEAQLQKRITPQSLSQEAELLRKNDPSDELPYGQAWLMVTLSELSRHPWAAKWPELSRLRQETRERVLRYLEKSPFPEGRPGRWLGLIAGDPKHFSRAHPSWLFGYFLLELSGLDPAHSPRMKKLQARVEANRAGILAQSDYEPHDFLYLPAVLQLIDLLEKRPGILDYRKKLVDFPTPPVTTSNAHQSGAVMVSAWPYAIQASGKKDVVSCRAFSQLMNDTFAHPEYWSDDPKDSDTFLSVGHWVPQFVWMGIWLEQGRP